MAASENAAGAAGIRRLRWLQTVVVDGGGAFFAVKQAPRLCFWCNKNNSADKPVR